MYYYLGGNVNDSKIIHHTSQNTVMTKFLIDLRIKKKGLDRNMCVMFMCKNRATYGYSKRTYYSTIKENIHTQPVFFFFFFMFNFFYNYHYPFQPDLFDFIIIF